MSVDTLGYGYYVVKTDNIDGDAEVSEDGERVSFPVDSGPYKSEGAARQHGLHEFRTIIKAEVPDGVDFE